MKKKIRIIVFAILAILVLYLVLSKGNGTIKKDLRDFAVQDTSLVDKIFLVDKQNKTILLERKAKYWVLNNDLVARQDLVELLLKTMMRIKVKDPVPKSAKENIIKNLAVKSTKVEIYEKGKLSKTYYVGGPTKNSHGTYMILENSASPFVMEIPGFRGFLSSRYTTNVSDWRSQLIYSKSINEISEVILEDFHEPQNSYVVSNVNNDISLFSYPDRKKVEGIDPLALRKYLMGFRTVGFAKFVDDVPPLQMDSVLNTQPFLRFTMVSKDEGSVSFDAFFKPGWDRLNEFGEQMPIDVDYFFIRLENQEMVYAQFFVFDPIFKRLKDFK